MSSKREKEARLREKECEETKGVKVGGEKEEKGKKKSGLTDISCHLQIPRHYGTFPWVSREGRTGTRPSQKPEPELELSAKRR